MLYVTGKYYAHACNFYFYIGMKRKIGKEKKCEENKGPSCQIAVTDKGGGIYKGPSLLLFIMSCREKRLNL